MRSPPLLTLLTLALLLSLGGCGSKISEANYYRVHHGMSEDDVEDVLGPAHRESAVAPVAPAATASSQPAPLAKVKSWTRGGLTIHVRFEDGVVTSRTAEGPAAEAFKR